MPKAKRLKRLSRIITPYYQGYVVTDVLQRLDRTKGRELIRWLDTRDVILHAGEELITRAELEFFLKHPIEELHKRTTVLKFA